MAKVIFAKLNAEDQRRAMGETGRGPRVEPRTLWFTDEMESSVTGYVHILGVPVFPRKRFIHRSDLLDRAVMRMQRVPWKRGELERLTRERAAESFRDGKVKGAVR